MTDDKQEIIRRFQEMAARALSDKRYELAAMLLAKSKTACRAMNTCGSSY